MHVKEKHKENKLDNLHVMNVGFVHVTLISLSDPLGQSLVQWWEESLVSLSCASLLLSSALSVARRRQQEL